MYIMQVTATFHMIAKNMDVTRFNLLHKIWCNIQIKTEKSFSNLAASQFCFSRSNKSTKTLQFRFLQGCVIVALQGCVIVASHGCIIVALRGFVIVLLQGCVIVALQVA
jgi:hypothetical protein